MVEYLDDFEDPSKTTEDWLFPSGEWVVEEGYLAQKSITPSNNYAILNREYGNISAEVSGRFLTQESPHPRMGISVRSQTPPHQHAYRLEYQGEYPNIILWRWSSEGSKVFAVYTLRKPFKNSISYNLRLEAFGNRFKGYLNHRKIIDVTDQKIVFLSGKPGLKTYGDYIQFDNFKTDNIQLDVRNREIMTSLISTLMPILTGVGLVNLKK